jgi:hypothetical protein
MRLSFEAAAAAAAGTVVAIEHVPPVTESDAPAQDLQVAEDTTAGTTATAAAPAAVSAETSAVSSDANSGRSEVMSAEDEEQLDVAATGVDSSSSDGTVEEPRSPLYSIPLWFELLEGGT